VLPGYTVDGNDDEPTANDGWVSPLVHSPNLRVGHPSVPPHKTHTRVCLMWIAHPNLGNTAIKLKDELNT